MFHVMNFINAVFFKQIIVSVFVCILELQNNTFVY